MHWPLSLSPEKQWHWTTDNERRKKNKLTTKDLDYDW